MIIKRRVCRDDDYIEHLDIIRSVWRKWSTACNNCKMIKVRLSHVQEFTLEAPSPSFERRSPQTNSTIHVSWSAWSMNIPIFYIWWRRAYTFARRAVYLDSLSIVQKTCTPLILYAVPENEVKTGTLDLHYRPWCVLETFRMSGATFSCTVRKPVRILVLGPSTRSIGSVQVLQISVYVIPIIGKNRDFF